MSLLGFGADPLRQQMVWRSSCLSLPVKRATGGRASDLVLLEVIGNFGHVGVMQQDPTETIGDPDPWRIVTYNMHGPEESVPLHPRGL